MNIMLILELAGVAIKEAQAFTNRNSTAGKVEGVSADLLAAMNAVIKQHAADQGKTIEEVLATL